MKDCCKIRVLTKALEDIQDRTSTDKDWDDGTIIWDVRSITRKTLKKVRDKPDKFKCPHSL